jgi:hypothetical protein
VPGLRSRCCRPAWPTTCRRGGGSCGAAGRRLCAAPVLDVGLADERIYIVSGYIDGASLHRRVTEGGPLDEGGLDFGIALALGAAYGMTAWPHWGEAARWYPDVVAVGAVHNAWQVEFDRLEMPFRVRPKDAANPRTATVDNGERHAYLILSPWERRFILGLRARGWVMLGGHAPDLTTAAGWPFLGSVALATARERGDHRESSWLSLRENHRGGPVAARLLAFVALAFHEPPARTTPVHQPLDAAFQRHPDLALQRGLPGDHPRPDPQPVRGHHPRRPHPRRDRRNRHAPTRPGRPAGLHNRPVEPYPHDVCRERRMGIDALSIVNRPQ